MSPPVDYPLVLTVLTIERPLLQRAQLQREPRSELPQPRLLPLPVELVPVMPEEHVVPLIVERDHPLPLELGLVVEQRAQHPAHRQTEPCREIVEHHFGPVRRDVLVVPAELRGDPDVGDLEVGGGTVGQVDDEEAVGFFAVLVHDQDVGVTLFRGATDDFFHARAVAEEGLGVGDDSGEFLSEDSRFLQRCCVRSQRESLVISRADKHTVAATNAKLTLSGLSE